MKRSQNSSPTLCRCNGCTSRNPKGLLWEYVYPELLTKNGYKNNIKKIWRKINE